MIGPPTVLESHASEQSTVSRSPQKAYQALLGAGQFRIQKCAACGRHVFHPRLVCPHCGDGSALHWIEPSGLGCVHSTTIVRRKQEDGGDYNVALIDLDEGVRMMSRVDGVEPSAIRIGQRVRAGIVEENGAAVVVFRLAETAP